MKNKIDYVDITQQLPVMRYRDNPTLYAKIYRENNPSKNKEACKRYYAKNRERELLRKKSDFQKFKANGYSDKRRIYQRVNQRYRKIARQCENPLTYQEWLDILELANYQCSECGTFEDLTMDHIIPISKGGLHTKSNIGVKCRSCNSSKGAKI